MKILQIDKFLLEKLYIIDAASKFLPDDKVFLVQTVYKNRSIAFIGMNCPE